MMTVSIITCAERGDIAVRALDFVIDGLRAGIRARGQAHLALTGGSSAAALFALLRSSPRARRVDWRGVHVWQGDERFVPADDPDSNWSTARREWLAHADGPDIPAAQQHPIPVADALVAGHGPDWAAAQYSAELQRLLPRRYGIPAFDVLLLGLGGDGHILSTFPGTPPIAEQRVPALAVAAPTHIEPHLPRITLAPFLLRAAGSVVVMVPGAAKAAVVADCLDSPREPQRLPAQLAIVPQAVWLLEPGSASAL
jgi:6-phosphogluconolactonase